MSLAAQLGEIAKAFEGTLATVACALNQSFGSDSHWGVAGFQESALVFLLAETMRRGGWEVEYEKCYPDGSRRRCDIIATRPKGRGLWMEAKWWWHGLNMTEDVIEVEKLKEAPSDFHSIAVLFTVDQLGQKEGWFGVEWSASNAAKALRRTLEQSKLEADVDLAAVASVESRYVPRDGKVKPGLFVAGFFELRR